MDRIAVQWLRATTHDLAIARNPKSRAVPDYDAVVSLFCSLPNHNLEQRRNKAILVILMLYVPRVDAAASLTIGDVNLDDMSIFQDANTVRVKFSKSQTTFPVNLCDEALNYLRSWVEYLKNAGLPVHAALFPQNGALANGTLAFNDNAAILSPWRTSGSVRRIIRRIASVNV